MKIAQITDGPEEADLFVANGTGVTISAGRPVHLLIGASCDGNKVGIGDTLNTLGFLGVAVKDIAANNNPGSSGELVRSKGRLLAYIFAHGASVTVGAGAPIGPGAAASNGFSSTGLKATYGPLIAANTIGASVCSGGGLAYVYANVL